MLEGNSDGHSIKDVILAESIHARFVRIYPLTWSGMICLRAEVYGCSTQGKARMLSLNSGYLSNHCQNSGRFNELISVLNFFFLFRGWLNLFQLSQTRLPY